MSLIEFDNVFVKRSNNGKGLFTKKEFRKEAIIFKVKGILIPESKMFNYPLKIRNNFFMMDKNNYLYPKGKEGEFINHSCNPNCGIKKNKKNLFIFAIKNIKKGNELLIDYSTTIANDDAWVMKCNCKDKNCRKTISKFSSLPYNIKRKYISSKMAPKYLFEID